MAFSQQMYYETFLTIVFGMSYKNTGFNRVFLPLDTTELHGFLLTKITDEPFYQ